MFNYEAKFDNSFPFRFRTLLLLMVLISFVVPIGFVSIFSFGSINKYVGIFDSLYTQRAKSTQYKHVVRVVKSN